MDVREWVCPAVILQLQKLVTDRTVSDETYGVQAWRADFHQGRA
jgi:hypothetical protein